MSRLSSAHSRPCYHAKQGAGNDTRYANASHGMDVPANAAYFTVMGPHGVPHSFLVSTTAISQGQEILTDYGEHCSELSASLVQHLCSGRMGRLCSAQRSDTTC